MKRTIIIIILTLGTLAMRAQSGLNVNALFDGQIKQSPSATEILVEGSKAKEIGLDLYRSLTVTDLAQARVIETAVIHDGAKAKSKEVEYRAGKLYYGFYELGVVNPQTAEKHAHFRYMFYLNRSLANQKPQNRVTIIYMESRHDAAYIKRLIKK